MTNRAGLDTSREDTNRCAECGSPPSECVAEMPHAGCHYLGVVHADGTGRPFWFCAKCGSGGPL